MENITAYRNAMAGNFTISIPLKESLKTEYDKYKNVTT
jgi:hypothetical protein